MYISENTKLYKNNIYNILILLLIQSLSIIVPKTRLDSQPSNLNMTATTAMYLDQVNT